MLHQSIVVGGAVTNCGDSSISKTVLQHTAPVDLFMKEVVNAGY